jgi:hypothetical protein
MYTFQFLVHSTVHVHIQYYLCDPLHGDVDLNVKVYVVVGV